MIYISAMDHRLTPTIASRLWELRTRQRLTRKALATKARINAETIYRIEGSRYATIRATTIEALAGALGVSPAVLTGELPMPAPAPQPDRVRPPGGADYSINVPVDGAVRNAFSLVQMRYR